MELIKRYYYLTKPGIIYGNTITAVAGFLLAAQGNIDIRLFGATIVGIGLVMASGCVFNNYIDRGIDKKMDRTKARSLVSGKISGRSALIYGSILGVLGVGLLALQTNFLATAWAIAGFVFYVVLYGIAKRRSVHGTVVGSISGAVPPVVGYVAVAGHFDLGALLLFFILVCWQMPHFYSIAVFRLKDYKAAGIPVLPLIGGMHLTKVAILMYIFAFAVLVQQLYSAGYTGVIYLVVMLALCGYWFVIGLKGFRALNNNLWARQMFKFSLIVLLAFSILISVEVVLP